MNRRVQRARRTAPQVLIRGDLYALDRVAFVHMPALERPVRVRLRFDEGGIPWRCDACGASRLPACVHAQTVADRLIRDLLYDDPEDID